MYGFITFHLIKISETDTFQLSNRKALNTKCNTLYFGVRLSCIQEHFFLNRSMLMLPAIHARLCSVSKLFFRLRYEDKCFSLTRKTSHTLHRFHENIKCFLAS